MNLKRLLISMVFIVLCAVSAAYAQTDVKNDNLTDIFNSSVDSVQSDFDTEIAVEKISAKEKEAAVVELAGKVTITNLSGYTVNFQTSCNGNSGWTARSLSNNYYNYYWCTGQSNYYIRFDWSYLSGIQWKKYKLYTGSSYVFEPAGIDLFQE